MQLAARHAAWGPKHLSRQVFWLPDQPTACAFPSHLPGTVACRRVRPRLQRRDRAGFPPASLLYPIWAPE